MRGRAGGGWVAMLPGRCPPPHCLHTTPAPTLAMVSIASGLQSPASLRWPPPALHLALGHHLASRLVTSVTMHSLMTPSCQPRTRPPISGQCVASGPIGWRVYEAAWRINTSVERGEALVAVPASTAAHWSCDDSYWDLGPRETNGIYVL